MSEVSKIDRLAEVREVYDFEECHWLPGDASNRFYGRLYKKDGSTRILMVMNAPEAFKSEEVTGGDDDFKGELPFVFVAKKLSEAGVHIPQIDYVDPHYRFLITEDFGDRLLYQERQETPALDWYEKAIDELVKLQKTAPFVKAQFTSDLLMWEFEHFREYALEKRGMTHSKEMLINFFEEGVEVIKKSPYCLQHRDFHSKNLMIVADQRIGVIDFQDVLLGPPVYDLASLLRDSYIEFSDEEENRLVSYYCDRSDYEWNQSLYDWTSLQRNMKAVGRFYYISLVKGRDTHLPYVLPTVKRMKRTLSQMGRLEMCEMLDKAFPEGTA